MAEQYDVVVLGGGIGGYTAAIRAAQLGKNVAIVEKHKLGGTCLHRGCIPSKTLLKSAELYAAMKNSAEFGISASDVALDFGKVQERKLRLVDQLTKGLDYLMKKNKIRVVYGHGRIIGPSIFSPRSGSVAVEKEDGEIETLVNDHLIIATGSQPRNLPGLETDGERIMTSDEALRMEKLPESILIVGGGAIGVEWASMLNDFGVRVTVIEYENRLIPAEDEEISRELERLLKKRGVRIVTGAKIVPDTLVKNGKGLVVQAERKGGREEFAAEKMLVSVGRQAAIHDIGLENTGVKVERGLIKVNSAMQTAEGHIYAVGDVIGGPQLAHAAAHEGLIAAEHLAGRQTEGYASHRVPRCIYARPEIASVGWTEQQAVELGYDVKTGKFPFRALGKALIEGDAEGFVKVVADRKTNDLLGVHMIGPHVTNYISEAALAQLLDATPWEVGQTIHPHPTLSESLFEAMLAVDDMAIGI